MSKAFKEGVYRPFQEVFKNKSTNDELKAILRLKNDFESNTLILIMYGAKLVDGIYPTLGPGSALMS